jgi:UDP-N-acetyl-D-galactosamine dehydrogenase
MMLGITFKENCLDVRKTKIVDVIAATANYGITLVFVIYWQDQKM